jgi:hypothetical protein
VSARRWRESETERRKILRPFAKAAAGVGLDLKELTAAGRARFEERCKRADGELKKLDTRRRQTSTS